MRFAGRDRMREIDRVAIGDFRLPSIVLMEAAGVKTCVAMEKLYGRLDGRRCLIVAGPGNNGGDGLVVARHLWNGGALVQVALLADPSKLAGDPKTHLEILTRMKVPVESIADEAGLATLDALARGAEFLVDAIFGTGLERPVEGLFRRAVEIVNASRGKRIAVDAPTGICADTGQALGTAVRADATVTFGLPKAGFFLYPGAANVGRLFVADIGFPRELLEAEEPPRELIDTALARKLLPERPADGHKGTFGRVLALAGSGAYSGAALLACLGALKIGGGLCTLASTRECLDLATVRLPEAVRLELPAAGEGHIAPAGLLEALGEARLDGEILLIGPGLGRDPELLAAAGAAFRRARRGVLDADGLRALDGAAGPIENGRDKVITPHPGEAAHLLGRTRDEVNADRIGSARALADRFGVNALLKGAGTVLALPGGGVYLNTAGSNALAKGGTGDVLSGFIAGLMAQGMVAADAAALAAFLHGLSGERAAKEGSNYSVLATEIAEGVGRVLGELEKTGVTPA